jgi:purine-binding chemotaxis protein CheW
MSAGEALKQIVTFRLGGDLFAADIFAVDRVLRFQEPRAIPNMPGWMEGVIDYQARVVPVVDLRKRFELQAAPVTAGTRTLVLNVEGELVAAIVDEVLDVTQPGAGKVTPPPQIFRGLSGEFILGMVRRDERIVVVLDFTRVFSTNERLVLEQMRAEDAEAQ